MEKFWEPPTGELIVSANWYGDRLLIFTNLGVYKIKPPSIPWYKKLWAKVWGWKRGGLRWNGFMWEDVDEETA